MLNVRSPGPLLEFKCQGTPFEQKSTFWRDFGTQRPSNNTFTLSAGWETSDDSHKHTQDVMEKRAWSSAIYSGALHVYEQDSKWTLEMWVKISFWWKNTTHWLVCIYLWLSICFNLYPLFTRLLLYFIYLFTLLLFYSFIYTCFLYCLFILVCLITYLFYLYIRIFIIITYLLYILYFIYLFIYLIN